MPKNNEKKSYKWVIVTVISLIAAGGGVAGWKSLFQKSSVNSVEILPPKIALAVSETIQLSVNQKDVNGSSLNLPISWSSSNNSVASVLNGKVTAHSDGNAVISANVKGVTGISYIKVASNQPSISSIQILPSHSDLNIGESVQLKVNQKDVKGNPLIFPIAWSSSNNSVASVLNGKVTAHSEGRAVINASIKGVTSISYINVAPNNVSIPSSDKEINLSVTFNKVYIIDDTDKGAGDIWFLFEVNGNKVRWPQNGSKKMKSNNFYSIFDKNNEKINVSLSIKERENLLVEVEGFEIDPSKDDRIEPMGIVKNEFTKSENWGKGDHNKIKSTCPKGCYEIYYDIDFE